jgi:4-aminobutyrate aminotransferase
MEIEGLAGAQAPNLITELPGPIAREVLERDARVTSPSLPRVYPFVPKRGAGSVVEDVDGNIFLDLNAGIAVTSTGHCHPKVVDAIQRQAAELIHYSASDFFLPIYSEVAERLDEIAPMSGPVRAFLTNSGTEAVEAGMKLARWATGRQYIIGFYGSFHGRSYGSVSLTASKATYRAGFGPLLPGILHAYYGDGRDMHMAPGSAEDGFPTIDYIEHFLFSKVVSAQEVAAIVVEPVLGEGGYIVPPDGWLPALRELCDRHGILLVCDGCNVGWAVRA